jgi:mitochondrial fission protein ELM1
MPRQNNKQPLIWLVISDKGGDNSQLAMVSNALGLPVVTKTVLPKPQYVLGKPFFRPSVHHLDLERSDKLEAPWPDLILTIGRRPGMASLWIQKQSGFKSKIVLLGRPKRFHKRFSLIITPSQYQVPDDPCMINLKLPLFNIDREAINREGEAWKDRLAELPRPITALMVGGKTDPFCFDAQTAMALMTAVKQQTAEGTLYISTSRRTLPEVTEVIRQQMPANGKLFCWGDDSCDNPYRPLLSQADNFVVTGDSVSMMVEVAQMEKPLAIYALPNQRSIAARLKLAATGYGALSFIVKPLFSVLQATGLVGYTRDLTNIHRYLYQKKLAVPFGENLVESPAYQEENVLAPISQRIKQLLPLQD